MKPLRRTPLQFEEPDDSLDETDNVKSSMATIPEMPTNLFLYLKLLHNGGELFHAILALDSMLKPKK
jgi:hypothetical protein